VVIRSSLRRRFVLSLDFDSATLSINFKDQRAFVQMPFLFSLEKSATLPRAQNIEAGTCFGSRIIFVV
jgi:hypothetical protein